MRTLQIFGLLVLGGVLAYVTAEFADPSPADDPAEEARVIKVAPENWLASCLADWDTQTHMNISQWRTSCERVSSERRYLQLSTASITARRPAARGGTRAVDPRGMANR